MNILDTLARWANRVLQFLLWLFLGDTAASSPGETAASPLELEACPGITSLLDIALFRTVQAELTGTLSTSHGLLLTWLEIQRQAQRVLQTLRKKHHTHNTTKGVLSKTTSNNHHHHHHHHSNNSDWSTRQSQMESFAKACFEASCDMIECMATDRFAQTGNLSDPFPLSSSVSSSFEGHSSQQQSQTHNPHDNINTNSMNDETAAFWAHHVQASAMDTGRRLMPLRQRPRDCWESPRLFCPDFVWGEHVITLGLERLRQLVKHSYCAASLFHNNHNNKTTTTSSSSSSSSSSPLGVSSFPSDEASMQDITAHGVSLVSSVLAHEESHTLVRLVLVEAPQRLIQFQAALHAESVVSKRLYLIKSEYRAPLRAFWEAHSSVQRAPRLALIQETLDKWTKTSTTHTSSKHHPTKQPSRGAAEKARLQQLLETPALVKLVAYEQKIQKFELDMASALLPFCEVARYLDAKKATPIFKENVLARLRQLLVVPGKQPNNNKGTSTASAGIRPLLLDFQAVPRDEEPTDDPRGFGGKNHPRQRVLLDPHGLLFLRDPATLDTFLERVDDFVENLQVLAKCVSPKHIAKSFHVEKKAGELHPPTAKACRAFDAELFKAQFHDWWTLCVKQYEITVEEEVDPTTGVAHNTMDALAEEIRRAEMAVSLAMVTTPQALQKVQERVQVISRDCTKRFQILQQRVEDVCLREMDLYVRLSAPDVGQVLELRSTDQADIPIMGGVFGQPLLHAQQNLPLG